MSGMVNRLEGSVLLAGVLSLMVGAATAGSHRRSGNQRPSAEPAGATAIPTGRAAGQRGGHDWWDPNQGGADWWQS